MGLVHVRVCVVSDVASMCVCLIQVLLCECCGLVHSWLHSGPYGMVC